MNDFLGTESRKALEELTKGKAHLRELAEKLKIAPSTAFNALRALESKGIVKAERKKNTKVFRIDYENPFALKILSLIFLEKILESKAFKKFKSLNPKAIMVFGSIAKGNITADSDIDIAFHERGKASAFKISEIKRELEKELKKETQILTLNDEKLQSLKKQNTELYNQLRYNSIVLFGERIE